MSVCLEVRKWYIPVLHSEVSLKNSFRRLKLVFNSFRLLWCKVCFLFLGIPTSVWGKHCKRSNQISCMKFYVLTVFFKDLEWSFIVVNAEVLNVLPSKPSNACKRANSLGLVETINE